MKFGVGLVTAAVLLTVLEGGLRVVWRLAAPGSHTHVTLRNQSDFTAKSFTVPISMADGLSRTVRWGMQSNVLTFPDSRLLFRVRPNPSGAPIYCYTRIDEQGFRSNGEVAPSTDDGRVVRILLLGDSCAFGWGICDFRETIGAEIERQLGQSGVSARVFNRAQPGYSSAQGVLMFRDWFPRIRPWFVILYFGWNDRWLAEGLNDAEALRLMPILSSRPAQFLTQTAIYRTIDWLARAFARGKQATAKIERGHVPGPPYRVAPKQTIANFATMIEEKFGAEATFPSLEAMQPHNPERNLYFGSDGYHPNHGGTQYIAAAIVEAVLKEIGANTGTR